jgi:hypothetical protein
MVEYESFAYLDVPKTGSSFITNFLREYCAERQLQNKTHRGVKATYDSEKLYFISVRNPLDQYISLYLFGCQQKGRLFLRAKNRVFDYFYDGTPERFRSWLGFMLDPENYEELGGTGDDIWLRNIRRYIGFQSYRVLTLSVPKPRKLLANVASADSIREAYLANNISRFTVRNETLRKDLAELVSTRLQKSIRDHRSALEHIETAAPLNVSPRIDGMFERPRLDKQLQRLLEEREWLLHESFGY